MASSDMLTGLEFLEKGATFPPRTQNARRRRYMFNKSKFDNKLKINKKAYDHIISLVDDKFRVISYRMLVNIYRKVSYKTADLLFVERPLISAGEDNKNEDTLKEIVKESKLWSIGYQGAIDVSRYGDSIYTVKVADKKGKIGITTPQFWYPVVDENDLKEIKYHVLMWKITRTKIVNGKEEQTHFIKYQIHSKGSYQTGEAELKDGAIITDFHCGLDLDDAQTSIWDALMQKIGAKSEIEIVDTGLDDFAVIPTHGVVTSESIFGIDDYVDLVSLIDELQIRLEKIAHVLDKHSDPSLSGPSSALTKDPETGEWSVKLGGYYPRDTKESPEAKYITWDAQMEASFKQIEVLKELISDISEMGAAIFGEQILKNSGTLSGRALKLLYVNPLTKVARIRNNFDDTFKHAVSLASQGYGKDKAIEEDDISIKWRDGLPNDPKEDAEIAQIRAGAPTDSVHASIVKLDQVTPEQADDKYDQMLEEKMISIPPSFGGDEDGDGDLPEENDNSDDDN